MKEFSFSELERIIMEQAEKDFQKMQKTKRTGDKKRKPRSGGTQK